MKFKELSNKKLFIAVVIAVGLASIALIKPFGGKNEDKVLGQAENNTPVVKVEERFDEKEIQKIKDELKVKAGSLKFNFACYKMKMEDNMTSERSEHTVGIPNEMLRIGYVIYKDNESNEIYRFEDNSIYSKMVKGIYNWKIEGNYYTPLYKHFRVKYSMDLSRLDEDKGRSRYTINGKLEGTTEIEIRGICSIKKTKEIIDKSIYDKCKKYLEKLKMSKNK